jgi:hypothetical protein
MARDPGSGPPVAPTVGFDGTKFLALTTRDGIRSPVLSSFGVTASGMQVAGASFGLDPYIVDAYPEVACSPVQCLVTHILGLDPSAPPDFYGPGAIYVTAIGTGGPPLFTTALTTAADGPQDMAKIAYDGTNWLVVWANAAGIRAARVDATGQALNSPPLAVASPALLRNLSLTFDGQTYLVAWEDATGHVTIARITPAGVVLDPGGVLGPIATVPVLAGDLLTYTRPALGSSRAFVRELSF